jgi:hypothetical protein
MSHRDLYRIRLTCSRNDGVTLPRYDLSLAEVAERTILDPDDGLASCGATLHDATEWRPRLDAEGRLVLTCEVDVEGETEEAVEEAVDAAAVFVPGWSVETWSTVPVSIDADPA